MKDNIRNTNLRLNMKNPIHQKAWIYLQKLDKNKFHSYSNAIALAVVDFFDRYYKAEDDPMFMTREREEKLADRIIKAVAERLNMNYASVPAPPVQNTFIDKDRDEKYGDIDLDFISNE